MAKKGHTQRSLAAKIGISQASLHRKLKSGQFTLGEIEAIRVALGIEKSEAPEVFF